MRPVTLSSDACGTPNAVANAGIRLVGSSGTIEDNLVNGPHCTAVMAPFDGAVSVGLVLEDVADLVVARNVIIPLPLIDHGERALVLEAPGNPVFVSNALAVSDTLADVSGAGVAEVAFNSILADGVSQEVSRANLDSVLGLDFSVHDNLILLPQVTQTISVNAWPQDFHHNTVAVGATTGTVGVPTGTQNSLSSLDGDPLVCSTNAWTFDPHLMPGTWTALTPLSAGAIYPPDIDGDARSVNEHRGADTLPASQCGLGPQPPSAP